jgi:octaprenyl-diphosphate synthase
MVMTKPDLHKLLEPVQTDLDAFKNRLGRFLHSDSALINAVARHIFAARGKKIRPAILFLISRSAGLYNKKLIDAALAIELIHTATLLHDDVIDESSLRRGQETVNYRWNNLVAVLMGDFLFSKAFRIMVRTGSYKLMERISQATERVSYGELRQVEETANFDLSEDNYLKIISDKTASLFAVSSEAGPILRKATTAERTRFRNFGERIGIAFQIADDLLDYVGDGAKTGKEPGADLVQGKVTLPLIYSLNKSSRKTRHEIVSILSNGIEKDGINRIVDFVSETGGIDYAYAKAAQFAEKAATLCDSFKNNIYNRSLRGVLEFAVSREN